MVSALPESPQQEAIATPELLRNNSSCPAEVLPGEATLPRERSSKSMRHPSSESHSKLRDCKSCLTFMPWWPLLAIASLIAGIVMFAVKARSVGNLSQDLFGLVGSGNTGFPKLVSVFRTSYPASLGVAGGVIAASLLALIIRVNQKLRKQGGSRRTGAYPAMTFRFFLWVFRLLLVYVLLTAAWFILNLLLLVSWELGLKTVQDGTRVAAQTLVKVDSWSGLYAASWNRISTAVGSSNLDSSVINDVTQMEVFSPVLVPTGQPSLLADSLVPAADSVCPSVRCLNLALYSFLESTNCACTEELLGSIHNLSSDALLDNLYSLVALGCLVLGCILVGMQLIVGLNLLAADQLWLRVVRRRSSSSRHRNSEMTPPAIKESAPSGSAISERKLLQHEQLLSSAPPSAARRLPYSSPPMYHVHSDSRQLASLGGE